MRARPYDLPEINRRLFFPIPGDDLPEATQEALPVRLAAGGETLSGFWSRPLERAPSLLYLHGNGECIGDQLRLWPGWARDAGLNLFLLDYPGYGDSAGRPSLSACLGAARAAAQHLLASSDGARGLYLMGRSIGSVFALALAATLPGDAVRGLVVESGIADLKQRLAVRVPYRELGLDREAIERSVDEDFDARRQLASITAPVLVLHCRFDTLVPLWHAEQLAAWAGPRLHRLVIFDEGDHNSIQALNAWEYQLALRDLTRATAG